MVHNILIRKIVKCQYTEFDKNKFLACFEAARRKSLENHEEPSHGDIGNQRAHFPSRLLFCV